MHWNMKPQLTWPPPLSLFVSFTLLKETGAFIQCAPKFGESGWMYTQLGAWGSGLPPGTHSPFTYFQRWLSAATKSSKNEYIAFGSKPDTFTFSTGNIRLVRKRRETVNLSSTWTQIILNSSIAQFYFMDQQIIRQAKWEVACHGPYTQTLESFSESVCASAWSAK